MNVFLIQYNYSPYLDNNESLSFCHRPLNVNANGNQTMWWVRRLSNITKESSETVKLKCEVSSAPAPSRYRWYKNEAPVREEKGRVIIRK